MRLRSLVTTTVLSAIVLQAPLLMAATSLKTDDEKISYSIGVDLGKKFKEQSINIQPELLLQGFKDAQGNKTLLLDDKEMNAVFVNLQKTMLERRMKQFQQAADDHLQAGKKFLDTNKSKSGVTTTASGLQYKIIKAGTGPKPTLNDMVSVEYTGKTIDGKVFDSTEKSGKPAEFQVNQVIAGWQEALMLMQPGAEWEVVIPSNLAYGPRGAGQMIGPNETLVFSIHLITVKPETKTTKK